MRVFRGAIKILAFLVIFIIFAVNTEARAPKRRYFEFTYKVEVKGVPRDARDVSVWIPYPTDDEDQKITDMDLESPYPATLKYDKEWGNSILYIKPDRGDSDFSITMRFKVLRHENLNDLSNIMDAEGIKGNPGTFGRYLTSTQYDEIIDTVKEFTTEATTGKKGVIEKARGIYDFILNKMEYNKKIPGWGHGDIRRVCLLITHKGTGAGNCTDFHSLFTAMMRQAGIPAKFVMGYPLRPGEDMPVPKEGGYHCWAKFFVPGHGWVPVDISEADKDPSKKDYFFGSICENRVKFSEGRNILLEPNQDGKRLNYFGPDPYIEVDGKPFDGFKRSVSYRNLK